MKMYIAVGLDCLEADIFGLRESHGADSPLLQSALVVFANDSEDAQEQAEALADFIVREDAVLTPRAEGIEDPYREEILEALREAQS